jgi:hypothetical protein
MILVPLFDLKFLDNIATDGAGTSNRRHLWAFTIITNAKRVERMTQAPMERRGTRLAALPYAHFLNGYLG